MNNFKIRIFQPLVPHYRVGLFAGIGKRYPGSVEICAPSQKSEFFKSLPVDGVVCDYKHPEIKFGPFYFMAGANLDGLTKGDVIVIEGNIRKLTFLMLAREARKKGIGVVWWGLHQMPGQRKFSENLRAWAMKRFADSILFYNKTGIEWMKNRGGNITHVFAVGNAIDQDPIKKELAIWTPEMLSEFQAKNGIENKRVILACSRLSDKVRLHEAIIAMADGAMPEDVELAIIGDGPLGDSLKALTKEKGVNDRVRFLGAMFDQHDMAPWFLSAKLFVYPGPVGLGILHALSYGLPAILNDTHNSTEAESFENGKTGRMFKEFDAKSLAVTIAGLLDDEGARAAMGKYAQERVFKYYTMAAMVNNWCEAIEDAHKQVCK